MSEKITDVAINAFFAMGPNAIFAAILAPTFVAAALLFWLGRQSVRDELAELKKLRAGSASGG